MHFMHLRRVTLHWNSVNDEKLLKVGIDVTSAKHLFQVFENRISFFTYDIGPGEHREFHTHLLYKSDKTSSH